MPQSPIRTSRRLDLVTYDIRGPLSRRARELEAEGRDILRLNIGNPGAFGFAAPALLREAVERGVASSEAYCHQQGLPQARAAIAAREQARGAAHADADAVFIGNGVSELIDLSLRALLDPGDEVLLPSPDYPLWSAAVRLNDGVPVYYDCPASTGFLPDPEQLAARIGPRTRAIVLINPNNPTGAVYPAALLAQLVELARRHGLLLLSDEIYDGIAYDGAQFTPLASLAGDTPCLTYGGLSKVFRACGYRVGWLSVSGAPARTAALRERLELLSALRLCSNVAGQWAIEPALAGEASILALTAPGGRLHETRRVLVEHCAASPHLELVAPQGALYAFPRVRLPGFDDQAFALSLLERESVLVVPGRGFNIDHPDHLRLTLLPDAATMAQVLLRMERELQRWAGASSSPSASVCASPPPALDAAAPACAASPGALPGDGATTVPATADASLPRARVA
jgi:alanine-synthesizing transaminase